MGGRIWPLMVSPVRRSKRRICAGRDVDVVGAGQVVVLGRAQEAEAVGQALQHAFGEDQAALFGLGLQDLEDQFLLAQAGGAGDVHVLGHLVELLNAHVLQLDQVERGGAVLGGLRGPCLRRCCAEVGVRSGDGRLRRLGGRRRGGGGRWQRRAAPRQAAAAAGASAARGGLASAAAWARRRSWARRGFGSAASARRLGFWRLGFAAASRIVAACSASSRGLSTSAFRRFGGGAFAGGCLFGGFFGLFLRQVVAYRG